jgi:hypothetical protein
MTVATTHTATQTVSTSDTSPVNGVKNGVKKVLTPKERGTVENTEFAAFARRILRAFGRRVAQGDIEALPELVDLADSLTDAITCAVIGLRDFGYSWTDVAARLGVSKQTAQQRWSLGTAPDRPSILPDASADYTLFDDLQTEAADDWA